MTGIEKPLPKPNDPIPFSERFTPEQIKKIRATRARFDELLGDPAAYFAAVQKAVDESEVT